jgi:hypothetical protein
MLIETSSRNDIRRFEDRTVSEQAAARRAPWRRSQPRDLSGINTCERGGYDNVDDQEPILPSLLRFTTCNAWLEYGMAFICRETSAP